MLKELYIENLAIIEKAVISFGERLNIFTGETGAGKSILIGGINAILGGRVFKDIVRAGAQKATVTALFDGIPKSVAERLAEYGYETGSDENDELLLSRDISADGKSTARICGKTATVAVLREIAAGLVDIHGQHDNQILLSPDSQRDILDSYGNIGGKIGAYATDFHAFSDLSRKIKRLSEENEKKEERLEFLNERITEVEDMKLSYGEEEEVEQNLAAARNAETIMQLIMTAYGKISGGDDESGAYDLLVSAERALSSLTEYYPACEELRDRLDSLTIELDDIRSELSGYLSDADKAQNLSYLEERMSDILRLKRKYGKDIDELLIELEKWKSEAEELEGSDDEIERLLEQRKTLGDSVKAQAAEITELRSAAADRLCAAVSEQLTYLDMPNVRLVFALTKGKVTVTGMDTVEMLISVNKGEEPKPVSKIASGGELSRIMLAIKSVLAECDDIPTMIFDEIDTGISGRAAQKVGVKLSEIASKRQVLCVTHLAQIAAMADSHLLIEKRSDETRTYTGVYPLDYEGRKREIARIISGDEKNEISLKNAEELMRFKNKAEK